MRRSVKNKICIMIIVIFISTVFSTPISIKADVDYKYDGINCQDEDHPYCIFINTIVIPAGYPLINRKSLHANMDIYYKNQGEEKGDKIVYGDYNDVDDNEQDANKEWRYLGFNMNGNEVSNEDFTNDREI